MNREEADERINLSDDTYADLARILDMMPPSMLAKIDIDYVNAIKDKAKKTNGLSSINPYVPLGEQEISDEVEIALGIIAEKYLKGYD